VKEAEPQVGEDPVERLGERFGFPDGLLGASLAFGELAQLGEAPDEPEPREQEDGRLPEALGRRNPGKAGDGSPGAVAGPAILADVRVELGQVEVRRELEAGIPDGRRQGQGALPRLDRPVVVAGGQEVIRQVRVDPPQS
jgi:hypothetical protein